jgi:hypothetical protein
VIEVDAVLVLMLLLLIVVDDSADDVDEEENKFDMAASCNDSLIPRLISNSLLISTRDIVDVDVDADDGDGVANAANNPDGDDCLRNAAKSIGAMGAPLAPAEVVIDDDEGLRVGV